MNAHANARTHTPGAVRDGLYSLTVKPSVGRHDDGVHHRAEGTKDILLNCRKHLDIKKNVRHFSRL